MNKRKTLAAALAGPLLIPTAALAAPSTCWSSNDTNPATGDMQPFDCDVQMRRDRRGELYWQIGRLRIYTNNKGVATMHFSNGNATRLEFDIDDDLDIVLFEDDYTFVFDPGEHFKETFTTFMERDRNGGQVSPASHEEVLSDTPFIF